MKKIFNIRFTRNGHQVEMRLRAWARENQHCFPNYGFTNTQDDHPITHQIRDYCVRNLNGRIEENDRRVTVYI
jgi:hypothetical protein